MHVSLHASEKHSLPPRDVYGDVSGTEELSAGPGRGWSENKGPRHTLHPGGSRGAPHRCSYRGGQDGQTVTEVHGKGNMEKEIINKCL